VKQNTEHIVHHYAHNPDQALLIADAMETSKFQVIAILPSGLGAYVYGRKPFYDRFDLNQLDREILNRLRMMKREPWIWEI
jgi:hypothetical protein